MSRNSVTFHFSPGDRVCVIHLGLNYWGRVDDCVYDGGRHKYTVEYADNSGEIRSHQFYGDELEGVASENPIP